ncbi:MAG TPA: hypothetical protein PK523_00690 [Elusimicrobiales bacterium]|nr:hypothetical protein [Elusimicrobiales bacterium]
MSAYPLFLKASLLFSWAALLCWSAAALLRLARDPAERRALPAALAAAAAVLLLSSFMPARGGYDNEHEFTMLSTDFLSSEFRHTAAFKEVAPLVTDSAAVLLGGKDLRAVLWKNRAVAAAALPLLYAALRLAGAGPAASLAAQGLFGFSFLFLLNASAFSSTASNIFIVLASLLMLAVSSGSRISPAGLAARASVSVLLVLTSRYEFLPPLGAAWGWLLFRRRAELAAHAPALTLAAGALVAGLWAAYISGLPSPGLNPSAFTPFANAAYHLGTMNFGVFLSPLPGVPAAALFFGVCAAALAWRAARRGGPAGYAAAWLGLWAFFFAAVYVIQDEYPLHFMRHQLYFLVPFTLLAAGGFASLPGGRGAAALLAAVLPLYAALNYRAARSFDGELRTSDRELALLAGAEADWPADAGFVYPGYGDGRRAPLLRRFFPAYRESCGLSPVRALKYVSPADAVFRDRPGGPLPSYARRTGADIPWKRAVFDHAFYTTGPGERKEPVRVEAGFFEPAGRAGEALLAYLDGRCRLRGRDFAGAASSFLDAAVKGGGRREVELAAVALALAGEPAAARRAAASLGRGLPEELDGALAALEKGRGAEALRLISVMEEAAPDPFFRLTGEAWLFTEPPPAAPPGK